MRVMILYVYKNNSDPFPGVHNKRTWLYKCNMRDLYGIIKPAIVTYRYVNVMKSLYKKPIKSQYPCH